MREEYDFADFILVFGAEGGDEIFLLGELAFGDVCEDAGSLEHFAEIFLARKHLLSFDSSR